jgi:hypothetical protein
MSKPADIISKLRQKKEELEVIKREISMLESDLYLATKDDINSAYKEKGSAFGVVHIGELVVNIPKKVSWDQKRLAELYKGISLSNENPSDYIKVTYDVSEAKYNAWPEAIRSTFDEARTVEPGKVTIKVGDE